MGKSEKYSTWQLLAWIWRASQGARIQALMSALIGIVSVVCSLCFVFLSKEIIDIATGVRSGDLMRYGIGMGVLVLAEILLHALNSWIVNTLGVKTQNRLRARLYKQLMQSEWQGKDRHSGDVLNRLVQDLNTIASVVTSTIPFVIITAVQFIASFCFLYTMDHTLAIVLVLILPFFALLSRFYVRRMRSMTKAVRESDSRIHAVMQESLQHRTVVKALDQTEKMGTKLHRLQERLQGEVIARTRFSVLSRSLVSMGFSLGYLTAFLWGVFRIQGGVITFGVMTAFLQLVGRIQRPLSDFARLIPTLVGALTSAERLMELEEQPLEEAGDPIVLQSVAGVRLEDVHFVYSDGNEKVLQGLSADFPPGSMTAILGETGAGKTTLIRLILALVRPTQGRVVLYDGKREVEASSLTRANLVYVPQGNTLFSATIRDNLLLGNPNATDVDLWRVLHIACADFVEQLPDGLDTLCSERGGGLSEGQAQRIAIARSLLRDGSILLLDEATSALDPDTEQRLLQRISSELKGKTLIFITHRPSVLEYCSRVLHV
ncbi:MAG: ABC transporter ATP-binding protein [Bacteroidaceae bacterium]|nr:ABC transporter ATP-binding protein [Bacteroidaceae bacterium]MBR5235065.1 ABC transporter ATP-binding protein [Bacteroidaceae bacterium]